MKTLLFTSLLFVLPQLMVNAQSSEIKTISEIEQEKKQSQISSYSDRNSETKAPLIKISKEAISNSTSVITIEDADLHQQFMNKEFRDYITSLFGVEYLIVSNNDPIIKITLLNSEVQKILVEKLGFTIEEVSKIN